MRHGKWIVVGAVAYALLGWAGAMALANRAYAATGVIRLNPPVVHERIAALEPSVGIGCIMHALMQTLMSRGSLTRIVEQTNLYLDERERMPLEDVVENMRKAIHAVKGDQNTVRISFSYHDKDMAERVTNELIGRFIAEFERARIMQAGIVAQVIKESADKAAERWEQSVAWLRTAEASGNSLARARLDSEIARRRYETLSERVAEAETTAALERSQLGYTLELLDPVREPAEHRPSILAITLGSAGVGALVGWVLSAARTAGQPGEAARSQA